MRLASCLCLISCSAILPADEPSVLLVARQRWDLVQAMDSLGLEPSAVARDIPGADQLTPGRYDAIALCSFDYPQPTRLSPVEVQALESCVCAPCNGS